MNTLETLPRTTFSGRRFTRKQLAAVVETVQTFPNLSRKELAQTVCENLSWKSAKGKNRIAVCMRMLEALEEHGLFRLPKKREADVAPKHRIESLEEAEQGSELKVPLANLLPITFERVQTKKQWSAFKASIHKHHYLGYKHQVGQQIGYFIVSGDGKRLGCLHFSASASWNLPDRDRWIGWNEKQRTKLRQLVVTQSRFLIFPWVRVQNLASHVLSTSEKQVANDWVDLYGYRPVLLETFVDASKFSGACYRAANWQHIGQTQGVQREADKPLSKDSADAQTAKDIFVRPLTDNVWEDLTQGTDERAIKKRYRNDGRKRHAVDEEFVSLWREVLYLLRMVAEEYDEKWRIRRRVIDTMLLILLIFRLVTSKNRQSYGTTIDELWDSCQQLDIPLPQKQSIAPSSLCKARTKLDENVFKTLNSEIIQAYAEQRTDQSLWWGHRIFAVDGSKINLPRKLASCGYTLPGDRANYPQGLLSSLFQLKAQLPVDFDLVAHSDERRCALRHLEVLKPDDLVVYDRGYFSYSLLHHHYETSIHAVFRLQDSSASPIRKFWESSERDAVVTLEPSSATRLKVEEKEPGVKLVPRKMRLVKYEIGGTGYCLGMTLFADTDRNIPIRDLADLYHERWGVEELYKVSKRIFVIEDFHAQHERGVKQEIFAHFVLVTLNRLFADHAEEQLNPRENSDTELEQPPLEPPAKNSTASRIKINFKNCIHVIARKLEPLVLLYNNLTGALDDAFKYIIKHHQKVRPGRSYPRKSMRPVTKWYADKRKSQEKRPPTNPTPLNSHADPTPC